MSRISLIDKIAYCGKHGENMPLKGHATVILTDVRDGTKKIIESDNMVTNAVPSIFAHPSALSRFDQLLPLRNLYGGVLCFQNPLTENANIFNPPSEDVSPLVAHCGDLPNTTESTLRGSRVPADEEETETSIKMAFFWPATAGNGTISSICLCPNSLGNMGLKPFDATISPFSTFGNDTNNSVTWDETVAMQYPFSISDDGKTAKCTWLKTVNNENVFSEKTVRHDYYTFGIMRGTRDWQLVSERTAVIRGGNNRIVFADDNYYYIARATSATVLQVDKVNKETFAVTQADCTFSGVSLWEGTINARNGARTTFAFDGTYLYFPNSVGNQFLKLNLANNTDVSVLDGEITINKGEVQIAAYDNGAFHNPLVINDGLILGDNYIINGHRAYQTAQTKSIGSGGSVRSTWNHLWLVRQGAAVYGNGQQTHGSDRWAGQSSVLCQMFLSTINNIEPVVKSTSLTCEILYTLREI